MTVGVGLGWAIGITGTVGARQAVPLRHYNAGLLGIAGADLGT